MANLQIPDYLQSDLEASARLRGRTAEELLEEIVVAYLEQEYPAPENFSAEQIARFKESIAQLDRGECVTSEQVDEFFVNLHVKLAAR